MASTDDRMEINVSDVDGGSTLLVRGEIDLGTAPRLGAEVSRLADAGRHPVRVDLREVSFMDSQGISVLAGAHRRLSTMGVTLSLVAPSVPVRRVLQITGVDRVLAIEDA